MQFLIQPLSYFFDKKKRIFEKMQFRDSDSRIFMPRAGVARKITVPHTRKCIFFRKYGFLSKKWDSGCIRNCISLRYVKESKLFITTRRRSINRKKNIFRGCVDNFRTEYQPKPFEYHQNPWILPHFHFCRRF